MSAFQETLGSDGGNRERRLRGTCDGELREKTSLGSVSGSGSRESRRLAVTVRAEGEDFVGAERGSRERRLRGSRERKQREKTSWEQREGAEREDFVGAERGSREKMLPGSREREQREKTSWEQKEGPERDDFVKRLASLRSGGSREREDLVVGAEREKASWREQKTKTL
jgi:hypothetical protein